MYDEDQEKPEPRQVRYEDVDPFEAGWETRIAFNNRFKYRVFFENDIGFKNGFQLDLLRQFLEDNDCGVEGQDWVLEESDFPMEQLWNRSQDDAERRLYGNSLYINELTWLVTQKLLEDPNDPDKGQENKHTTGRITVVQTRK